SPPNAVLRELLRRADPVASVYLGLRPPYATLDAAEDLDLRRHALVTRLADEGADEPTRTAVTTCLATAEPAPDELAVFAADGRILLAQAIPGSALFDRAGHAAPAAAVPLLRWWQRPPAPVIVVT